MYYLAKVILCFFPLAALILLIIGVHKKAIYYVISALWLSLIALILHYQTSGGEILGTYFNYVNASIYSVNLIVLFLALIRIISHLTSDNVVFRYVSSFFQALIAIGSVLVIINLVINAFFIENRMSGTPIMQVALIQKPEYCSYRYLFYKVAPNGSVHYLCPNHFGLFPSIGQLDISPDFITTQISEASKKQLLLLQKHKDSKS